jgi:hypothetical protein
MSPPWGEGRAGARLWAEGPARRNQGAIGPKSKPGAAGGAPGPARGQARRPASGDFFYDKKYLLCETWSRPEQLGWRGDRYVPPSQYIGNVLRCQFLCVNQRPWQEGRSNLRLAVTSLPKGLTTGLQSLSVDREVRVPQVRPQTGGQVDCKTGSRWLVLLTACATGFTGRAKCKGGEARR